MKIKDYGFLLVLAILIGFAYLGGCERIYTKYDIPSDNPLEEEVEEIIYQKIGIDIDLSPSSHEE